MRSSQPVSLLTVFAEALGLGVTAGLLHTIAETTLLGWSGLGPTVLDLAVLAGTSIAAASVLSVVAALVALSPPLRMRLRGPAAFRQTVWGLVGVAYLLVLLKIIAYWSGLAAALKWSLPAALALGAAWLAVRRKGQRALVVVCATAFVAFTFCALQLATTDLEALTGITGLTLHLFVPAAVSVLALATVVKATPSNRPFQQITGAVAGLAVFVAGWAGLWAAFSSEISLGRPFGESRPELSRASGPNFLLIVLDTVRADHLDLFGYHRPTMPNLRRFAEEECQVVNRMFTVAPWTLPSHASMFTGMYPSEHGAHYPFVADASADFLAYSMRGDVTTLAEFLRGLGYQTGGIVANYGALSLFGIPRGFQHYDVTPGSPYLAERTLWLYRFRSGNWPSLAELFRSSFPAEMQQRSTLLSVREPDYRRAREISTRAQRWLKQYGDRPFFLFLNYMDAHDPYLPMPEDDERFAKRPPGDEWFGFPTARFEASDRAAEDFTAQEVEFLRGQYDAALVSLDRELGALLDFLRESGFFENTLILITTDHGEAFFEHGFPYHGNFLYQPETDGLMLIKAPPSVGPIQASPLMQAVDIFPTFAAVIDEPVPANVRGVPWGNGRDYALSEVFCKSCAAERMWNLEWPDSLQRDLVAVIRDDLKLIRSTHGSDEVYRLSADPGELNPVSDPNPEFMQRAGEIIDKRNQRLVEGLTERPRDKNLLDRLRSLGYIK